MPLWQKKSTDVFFQASKFTTKQVFNYLNFTNYSNLIIESRTESKRKMNIIQYWILLILNWNNDFP